MKPSLPPLAAALALATFLLPAALRADDNADVTRLSPFVVTGLPAEASVNPLTREPSSVLGDDRDLLSTPRAVSSLTTALFNERQIHGVREILLYSPSAYAGASYGKTTVPNLRGDIAETYLNGQRLSYNLYGYFPSFNGVEAIDLVRGPGSAVFGAGYFTGGYVNYVTKQPSFSAASTVVTTRVGTWAPGETSYLNGSVQVDATAPVSDRLAWRVSFETKGGDTFWKKNEVRDDRADVFLALAWRPSPATRFDASLQYIWQASPEVLGVNRVNQELIWHDTYYTGASADLGVPGPIPATTAVKLPWDATLFSKGDFSNANIARGQVIVTHDVSPSIQLVNRSLYEHVDRRRAHQFEYAEYVTQDTAENRTEAHLKFTTADLPQSVIVGFTARYEGRESYTNYFNEYFYNFDLTDPSRVFNFRDEYPNSTFPGFIGPGGREFFPASYDSPETVRSETWNPAAFWQQEIALTREVSAIVGLRVDAFYAKAKDPLGDAAGVPWRDAEKVSSLSQAYSLVYRPSKTVSFYLTHDRIRAANGNVTGGGVILNLPDGQINRNDFRNLSELFEAGVKTALLDNTLFAAATLFQQDRTRVSLGGDENNITLHGLELEATYQPATRLSLTANATFQSGHYVNAAPFQAGGRDIYAAYLLGRGPGGLGTSTGTYDPWGDQVPAGDWPLLGFSNTMLNASARYRWDNGFGVGGNVEWASRQRGNLDDQWHVPAQYTLNASVFYEAKRWSVNVDFLNVTNQHNWIHNGDAYTASELIFPELPFRMEGYFKIRF
ncbi:MAG: TonB-dependent receptor plug domain-containing protein [Verrucomicrobia bacterium]|nr:TonB-dependent receptor plug domain-containing protein [Verrucomicrobiota bacterium]